MSEEEKKAIEELKGCIMFWQGQLISTDEESEIEMAEKEISINKNLLNVIEKQQEQLQEKDKIILEIAKFIEDEMTVDEFCNKENCYADNYINGHCQKCLNCMIEYFTKKAREV